jgi:prepilin-type N-terminal cleavage/methylation domain-containing protein
VTIFRYTAQFVNAIRSHKPLFFNEVSWYFVCYTLCAHRGLSQMRHHGFTLIELMIVVAIIALIAAIAIPSLLRSRMAANEASAVASCHAFATAEEIYHRTDYSGVGSLKYATTLSGTNSLLEKTAGSGDLALIDKVFGAAEGLPGAASPKAGYVFTVLTAQGASVGGGAHSYVVNGNMTLGYALSAVPDGWDASGRQSFEISSAGVVYGIDEGPTSTHPTAFDPTASWVPVQ